MILRVMVPEQIVVVVSLLVEMVVFVQTEMTKIIVFVTPVLLRIETLFYGMLWYYEH